MKDLLTQIYFNNINPVEELDSIMKSSGFNVWKTLKQASELTGIHPDNLRQRIHRGTLEAKKIGNQWFLSDTTINKLLKE